MKIRIRGRIWAWIRIISTHFLVLWVARRFRVVKIGPTGPNQNVCVSVGWMQGIFQIRRPQNFWIFCPLCLYGLSANFGVFPDTPPCPFYPDVIHVGPLSVDDDDYGDSQQYVQQNRYDTLRFDGA